MERKRIRRRSSSVDFFLQRQEILYSRPGTVSTGQQHHHSKQWAWRWRRTTISPLLVVGFFDDVLFSIFFLASHNKAGGSCLNHIHGLKSPKIREPQTSTIRLWKPSSALVLDESFLVASANLVQGKARKALRHATPDVAYDTRWKGEHADHLLH